MKEVYLKKPGSNRSTGFNITEMSGSLDTAETVRFVKGYIKGHGRSRALSLVSKEPAVFRDRDFEYLPEGNAERYVSLWSYLKKEGFPVVSTVRVVSPTQIMMTDLTADGSGIYGKYETINALMRAYYKPQATNDTFRELDIEEVMRESQGFVEAANRRRVGLAHDDCFALRVRPSGKFQVMMLDIGCNNFRS